MTVCSVPSGVWSLLCELSNNLIESKVQNVANLKILLKKKKKKKKNTALQIEVTIKWINVRCAWQVSLRKVLVNNDHKAFALCQVAKFRLINTKCIWESNFFLKYIFNMCFKVTVWQTFTDVGNVSDSNHRQMPFNGEKKPSKVFAKKFFFVFLFVFSPC